MAGFPSLAEGLLAVFLVASDATSFRGSRARPVSRARAHAPTQASDISPKPDATMAKNRRRSPLRCCVSTYVQEGAASVA